MKVIGSGNEDFVSGQTDLRGVFVADGIRGGATVIAQAGPGRYAFYRAKETLVSEVVAHVARVSQAPHAAAPTRNRARGGHFASWRCGATRRSRQPSIR